jgi:hypothetical protein
VNVGIALESILTDSTGCYGISQKVLIQHGLTYFPEIGVKRPMPHSLDDALEAPWIVHLV